MPEGVAAYPRWDGELVHRPAFPTIAAQEVRRAWNHTWSRTAITLAFAYAVVYLGSLWTLKQRLGDAAHTWEAFTYFLGILRWAALGVAAIMAGTLLEDFRRGALELYYARAVTQADYLAGKLLAVLGLSALVVAGPGLIYYGMTFVLFENAPDNWAWAPLGLLAYAAMWAVVVTGLGLALSLVTRNARATSLLLFGGIAVLDQVLAKLLAAITTDEKLRMLSPMFDLELQTRWLFPGAEGPDVATQDLVGLPVWVWGLLVLGALALVSWVLVAVRRPRLAGVD